MGFLSGTLGGVTAMCLVQINRLNDNHTHNERENEDA